MASLVEIKIKIKVEAASLVAEINNKGVAFLVEIISKTNKVAASLAAEINKAQEAAAFLAAEINNKEVAWAQIKVEVSSEARRCYNYHINRFVRRRQLRNGHGRRNGQSK